MNPSDPPLRAHRDVPTARLWERGAIPAATVVVLRDGPNGMQVLVLRRDRDLSFAGGMWVFPGGRIDPEDRDPRPSPDAGTGGTAGTAGTSGPGDDAVLEIAARRAATREAAEEAGLVLDVAALHRWSHWTPPPESPKRFSTAFFLAALPDDAPDVTIDHGEIRDHRWEAPATVLELRDAGEVGLTPPTFITLTQLLPHRDVATALAHAREMTSVEHFATRICVRGDEVLALYHGDVGYGAGDADTPGPRHRLVMGSRWRYERTT